MRKITFLMAILAVFWGTNGFAGVKTSTAWFNAATFENYSGVLGTDIKANSEIKVTPGGAYLVMPQTASSTTSLNVSSTVLGFTKKALGTTAFGEGTNAGNWTHYFTSDATNAGTLNFSSRYFYVKSAFYASTGGTTYAFKNSDGNTVFEFGGINSSGGPAIIFNSPSITTATIGLGKRAQWTDIEIIVDLVTPKVILCNIANQSLTKKSYSFSNSTLTYGSNIKSLYINSAAYGTGGFDQTTIGELEPDNIKDITSSQSNHQTIGSTTVNTTFGVTNFTNMMSTDLPFAGGTELDIQWSISDWGGMPVEDQSKFSITRSSSDYTSATFSSNNSVSADYTITLQAVYGSTTLTKTVLVKGEDVNAMKTTLLSDISSAGSTRDAVTASNPYISSLKSTLNSALSSAQNTHDNSSSASEIGTATSTLQTAVAAFNSGMTPFNDFVTYIGTVTSGRDAETRTEPFFTTIKSTLTSAITTATSAKETVSTSTDISNAQTDLQTAYTQFTTDKPAFDNLNTQITSVGLRITSANLRKGDNLFLLFPTSTVQTLSDAKTTAENSRDNETTVSALGTAQTTLTNALNTFNSAARVGPGSSYYRIYTYGVDGGDYGSTFVKKVLFEEATTLKYKENVNALDVNSVWEVIQTTTNKYTIKNVQSGNYLNGTTLSGTSSEFTINENKSQFGLVNATSDSYTIYNIVNSSNKALELDIWDNITGKGVFTINSGSAERFRFAYQFEPITTLPASLSANLTDATNWSSGGAPSTGDIAVSGTLTVDQDATSIGNVNVTTGGQLNVNAGKKLTVGSGVFANNGTFTLSSDADNGTATFVNSTAIVNTITATVNQHLTTDRNWYVSSPVTAATAATLLTGASKVYKYNEQTAGWVELASGDALLPGTGYITQATATGNVAFAGTLNDGNVQTTVSRLGTTKAGFNLVGNPYPSYLNWKACIEDADNVANAKVSTTVWYRTKTTVGAYTFATYNATSNLGTNVETLPTTDIVTGNIPPMQAFWVRVVDGQTAGTLTFKNAMRAHKGSQLQSDEQTRNDGKLRAPALNQVLRLQVSNGANSDEAIVLFNNSASNDLDMFDSYKMSNNSTSIPEIYTTVGNENLVINGLQAYDFNTVLPLGFRAGETNQYVISASQISNFDPDTKIYLLDNANGTQTDLTAGDVYAFTSDATTTDSRFSVLFKSAAGTTDLIQTNQDVIVYAVDNQIFVENASVLKMVTAEVFNAVGQKVYGQLLNSDINQLSKDFASGAYVVKINDGTQAVAYKLIVR